VKINETIRKDGLRIITCYIPHKKSILVELIARVGSAYDPLDKLGLFHTFEHMAFKGTKKRTAKDLTSFAARNFINHNASTGALGTTYEVMVIDRKLPLACEYLCDIYLNSVFNSAELKKEKRPILLEIASRNDSDAAVAHHALNECLYKENPLRRQGGGTLAGIARVHRVDLVKAKNKLHIPSNTIAIAVGNVRHNDFVKEISKRIPFNAKKVPLQQWSDEVNELPLKKELTIKRPKRGKSILLLKCKIPLDIDLRTREAFFLFSRLIGRGPSSILWHEIRERRGLAYFIDSSYYETAGLGAQFSVYAEIHPSKSKQVEKLIWQVLTKPLTDNSKFKELHEQMFDSFEIVATEGMSPYSYESYIWENITEGKPVKAVETQDKKRLKIISKLTLKDLENVRKQFIRPERFVRVLVEPA
jgi:predicted Zn-dependent peptidase